MSEADERRSERRWWRAAWAWAVTAVAVGVMGTVTASAAGMRNFVLPSDSMAPTLTRGDRILTLRARDPQRGEVWVFEAPGVTGRGRQFIKRVVGLPGETVEVRNGQVRINGQPLAEGYLPAPASYTMPPLKLGPGHYYVLGDNRDKSNDSHTFGPVPRESFTGRVQLRYWPPHRVGKPR